MDSAADHNLRKYIDEIFRRYDTNKSGVLNAAELATFMNDLYMFMGMPIQIGLKEAKGLIKQVDVNGDGKLNKIELFAAFKSLHPAELAMLPELPKAVEHKQHHKHHHQQAKLQQKHPQHRHLRTPQVQGNGNHAQKPKEAAKKHQQIGHHHHAHHREVPQYPQQPQQQRPPQKQYQPEQNVKPTIKEPPKQNLPPAYRNPNQFESYFPGGKLW